VNEHWSITIAKSFLIVNLVLAAFAYTTLLERKLLGRMQLRYGPNRAGPFGLLQPIADLAKLIRKESFLPRTGVDLLFLASPVLAAFTALASFSVIPFGSGWTIAGQDITGQIVDVPIALILIFALGSIGVYGFIVGGWASNSKYSLLGSMRTCAQLVSYEVSLALSVLGVVIMGQSLSLPEIVAKQDETIWFVVPRPARGRDRARRRLPHGVRRDALGPLLDVRVRQHDHAVGTGRNALLRRLARAVAAGADLVRAQALHPRQRLHLAAGDAAAPAL